MAFENEMQGLSNLASTPEEGGPPDTGPVGPGGASPGPAQSPGGQGGPGIDTPAEQQALKLMMAGAMAYRKAATVDPTLRPIVDKHMQTLYMEVMKHYGMEQEGKLAMQQASLQRDREMSARVSPPVSAAGPSRAPV